MFGNDLVAQGRNADLSSANAYVHSCEEVPVLDRKSTRLNSSHLGISYAVFCLKKKKKKITTSAAQNNKQNYLTQTQLKMSMHDKIASDSTTTDSTQHTCQRVEPLHHTRQLSRR